MHTELMHVEPQHFSDQHHIVAMWFLFSLYAACVTWTRSSIPTWTLWFKPSLFQRKNALWLDFLSFLSHSFYSSFLFPCFLLLNCCLIVSRFLKQSHVLCAAPLLRASFPLMPVMMQMCVLFMSFSQQQKCCNQEQLLQTEQNIRALSRITEELWSQKFLL